MWIKVLIGRLQKNAGRKSGRKMEWIIPSASAIGENPGSKNPVMNRVFCPG